MDGKQSIISLRFFKQKLESEFWRKMGEISSFDNTFSLISVQYPVPEQNLNQAQLRINAPSDCASVYNKTITVCLSFITMLYLPFPLGFATLRRYSSQDFMCSKITDKHSFRSNLISVRQRRSTDAADHT